MVKCSKVEHPLNLFKFCPKCGADGFEVNNFKSKKCNKCGFVYYFNPSAAVACFIKDENGRFLIARRANEPAKDTLDLIGGFVDMNETGEEAVLREMEEETGLRPDSMSYLFSIPNIYMYSGFEVHTLDMFFECSLRDFSGCKANDDVSELLVFEASQLKVDDFGLSSVKEAFKKYLVLKNR